MDPEGIAGLIEQKRACFRFTTAAAPNRLPPLPLPASARPLSPSTRTPLRSASGCVPPRGEQIIAQGHGGVASFEGEQMWIGGRTSRDVKK